MKRLMICVALLLATVFSGALAQENRANPGDTAQAAGRTNITTNEAMEARVNAVSAKLRCVVCQGQSLADSPSELAQEMKDVIRSQLVAGKSEKEITDYFVGKYGEWILLEPQPHGFNWLAWVLPPLLLVVGGVGLALRMKRWTRNTGQPAA